MTGPAGDTLGLSWGDVAGTVGGDTSRQAADRAADRVADRLMWEAGGPS